MQSRRVIICTVGSVVGALTFTGLGYWYRGYSLGKKKANTQLDTDDTNETP
jgi:hypothetical protein